MKKLFALLVLMYSSLAFASGPPGGFHGGLGFGHGLGGACAGPAAAFNPFCHPPVTPPTPPSPPPVVEPPVTPPGGGGGGGAGGGGGQQSYGNGGSSASQIPAYVAVGIWVLYSTWTICTFEGIEWCMPPEWFLGPVTAPQPGEEFAGPDGLWPTDDYEYSQNPDDRN